MNRIWLSNKVSATKTYFKFRSKSKDEIKTAIDILIKSSSPSKLYLELRSGLPHPLRVLIRIFLQQLVKKVVTSSHTLAFPNYITIGDVLLLYHSLCLKKRDGVLPYLICPPTEPYLTYTRFLFEKNEYSYIDSEFYNLLLRAVDGGGESRAIEKACIDLILFSTLQYLVRKNSIHKIHEDYSIDNDKIVDHLKSKHPHLLQSYLEMRRCSIPDDQTIKYYQAMQNGLPRNHKEYPGYSEDDLKNIKSALGITKKYVCLHLRMSGNQSGVSRTIQNADAYVKGLKTLLNQGFQIVRLGSAQDQLPDSFRCLREHENWIDYATHSMQCLGNDLHLVSDCHMMIACSSGPGAFVNLFRVPSLILNNSFLAQTHALPEHRFYPKNIISSDGNRLRFEEWYQSPLIYSQFEKSYEKHNVKLEDLDEDQINDAIQDFNSEIEQEINGQKALTSPPCWYSDFYSKLGIHHLLLYRLKCVPSSAYYNSYVREKSR